MMDIEYIRQFFPAALQDAPVFRKYMIKEFIQLMILDHLSSSRFAKKLVFIGGTNLRLAKGIDRFSEDLAFDCKGFSEEDFEEMTQKVLTHLRRNGLGVELKNRDNGRLKAFRSNLHFPGLLFEMGLSGHREERFLIKLECQDQQVYYNVVHADIKGCGFYFPFPVPPDPVLCAMKTSAMLSRRKGRDFYDEMFLLAITRPDFEFLNQKCGIATMKHLKKAVAVMLKETDLTMKCKDFEHLLFNKTSSDRILRFGDFLANLPDV